MILKINPLKPEPDKIKIAADAIRRGGLVAFPTETVYGLGADAFNGNACKQIFLVKGRPQDNPLIVHVDSIEMANKLGVFPEGYKRLLNDIWPSPITFVVKKRSALPDAVTASLDTVALRMPAHPVALSLIKAAGVPIAAPSANLSGKPSPTEAKTIIKEIGDKVEIILDAGQTFFGLESTVIDLQSFTILRPGPFTPEEIAKKFGKKPNLLTNTTSIDIKPASPGMKYKHYAPDKPLFLFYGDKEKLIKLVNELDTRFCFLGSKETCNHIYSVKATKIPLGSYKNAYEIAKNLFSSLRAIDNYPTKFAIGESFDTHGIGLAIMNRLNKAAGGNTFSDISELNKLLRKSHVSE
jgi:L-threonylcarbamoyladenylate synthase